jgi:hypothetical protein
LRTGAIAPSDFRLALLAVSARHERHAERRVEAPSAPHPYDAMRLQAFRRDAAETAALSTMKPSTTATASTATAPAITTAAPQINPVAFQPDAPLRTPAPQALPAVRAPTAVEAAGSSGPAR